MTSYTALKSKLKDSNFTLFLICCYGYAVNGMAILAIGTILPSLIKEAGLSFAVAGGLLSLMAIGNFFASFFFPAAESLLGKRAAIGIMSALVPISLLVLTFLPSIYLLYFFMFLFGVARGSITIINNSVVNDTSENPAKMLNYLHSSFAVGAFLAPFTVAVFLSLGLGWRMVIYLLVVLCASSCVLYATGDYSRLPDKKQKTSQENNSAQSFSKSFNFYCISFLLFFYLGFENCINGWFVTYLQNTGVMTESFSASLISLTWIVILLGRLVCASLSKYISKSKMICLNCVGGAVFFLLLIMTKNLAVITISLMGLGFSMAGIYPNSVADAGTFMKGSTFGMAVLTAISSLGGIITPQIIGMVADRIGIVPAVSILTVNAILMVLFAVMNIISQARRRRS